MWTEAWPSLALTNLEHSLDALVELVCDPPEPLDDRVSAALARFLVVRTCGYLEQVVDQCCTSYIRSKSDPRSAAFGASWFGRGNNPTPSRLVELVRRFDPAWADDLQELFNNDDELLHREISFLVDRRNKIAHGLSEGIGVRKSLDLVDPTKSVCGWFINTLDPR